MWSTCANAISSHPSCSRWSSRCARCFRAEARPLRARDPARACRPGCRLRDQGLALEGLAQTEAMLDFCREQGPRTADARPGLRPGDVLGARAGDCRARGRSRSISRQAVSSQATRDGEADARFRGPRRGSPAALPSPTCSRPRHVRLRARRARAGVVAVEAARDAHLACRAGAARARGSGRGGFTATCSATCSSPTSSPASTLWCSTRREPARASRSSSLPRARCRGSRTSAATRRAGRATGACSPTPATASPSCARSGSSAGRPTSSWRACSCARGRAKDRPRGRSAREASTCSNSHSCVLGLDECMACPGAPGDAGIACRPTSREMLARSDRARRAGSPRGHRTAPSPARISAASELGGGAGRSARPIPPASLRSETLPVARRASSRGVAQLVGVARTDCRGRRSAVVVLDGPRIGEHQRVAVEARAEHAGALAASQLPKPTIRAMPRPRGAERRERRGDVGLARAEAAVDPAAVADAAAIEAEDRTARGGDPRREPRLSGERARTDLVAAADEQQSGGAFGIVERADQGLAFTDEAQVAPAHGVVTAAATIRASASACAGSWSGSARSHRPAPPRSACATLASAAQPLGSAVLELAHHCRAEPVSGKLEPFAVPPARAAPRAPPRLRSSLLARHPRSQQAAQQCRAGGRAHSAASAALGLAQRRQRAAHSNVRRVEMGRRGLTPPCAPSRERLALERSRGFRSQTGQVGQESIDSAGVDPPEHLD